MTPNRDPTGTAGLRRSHAADLRRRWRRVDQLVREALVERSMFGATAVMSGGQVRTFQTWFDALLSQTILGPSMGTWAQRYVAAAYARGAERATRAHDAWNEANHPREPAGSPKGGQWASVAGGFDGKRKAAIEAGMRLVESIRGDGLSEVKIHFVPGQENKYERSYGPHFLGGAGTVHVGSSLDPMTVVHEWGHAVEDQVPGLLEASKKWIREAKKRGWATGDGSLRYALKSYGTATELVSTGVQAYAENRQGFAQRAPEHYRFIEELLTRGRVGDEWRAAYARGAERVTRAHDAWNETDHPRHPEGTSKGGEFASKEGGVGASLSEAPKLSGREQFAIDNYAANGFMYINDTLRKGKEGEFSPSTRDQVSLLDKLTSSQKFSEDGVVYRGIEGKRFASKLKDGAVIEDKGFMSTSTNVRGVERALEDQTGRRNKVVSYLEIRVPKGEEAYSATNGRGESEVLFGRGRKLQVIGRRTENGREFIEVKIVR